MDSVNVQPIYLILCHVEPPYGSADLGLVAISQTL